MRPGCIVWRVRPGGGSGSRCAAVDVLWFGWASITGAQFPQALLPFGIQLLDRRLLSWFCRCALGVLVGCLTVDDALVHAACGCGCKRKHQQADQYEKRIWVRHRRSQRLMGLCGGCAAGVRRQLRRPTIKPTGRQWGLSFAEDCSHHEVGAVWQHQPQPWPKSMAARPIPIGE